MRNLLLVSLVCILFAACNKSALNFHNSSLSGKWQLTEYFMSPGDGGAWYPADNSTLHTIEFKSDNSFTSSDKAYNDAIGFNIINSNKLEFILPTQIPSTLECYYEIKDGGATLVLSPVGCIEGCSNRYRAVQSSGVNK